MANKTKQNGPGGGRYEFKWAKPAEPAELYGEVSLKIEQDPRMRVSKRREEV